MQDELYMARALKLAARGRFTTHPNPNVGCVIVKDGEIVGEGEHVGVAVRGRRSDTGTVETDPDVLRFA